MIDFKITFQDDELLYGDYETMSLISTLFSISLPKLRELQSLALESTNYDYESAEDGVTSIILDTTQYRLFRPVRSDLLSTDAKTHFIKLDFINKGIDAVNLPSILRSKQSLKQCQPTSKKKNHQ